jgi:hypothetical protein
LTFEWVNKIVCHPRMILACSLSLKNLWKVSTPKDCGNDKKNRIIRIYSASEYKKSNFCYPLKTLKSLKKGCDMTKKQTKEINQAQKLAVFKGKQIRKIIHNNE